MATKKAKPAEPAKRVGPKPRPQGWTEVPWPNGTANHVLHPNRVKIEISDTGVTLTADVHTGSIRMSDDLDEAKRVGIEMAVEWLQREIKLLSAALPAKAKRKRGA